MEKAPGNEALRSPSLFTTEESTRPDEAVEIVRRRFTRHRIHVVGERFHLTFSTGRVRDIGLHVVGCFDAVRVEADPLEDQYLLCMPAWGHASLRVGAKEWASDPTTPALLPVDRSFELIWPDGAPQLVLSLPRPDVERVATLMFGERDMPLALPHTVDLRSAAGRSVSLEIAHVRREITSGSYDDLPDYLRQNISDGLIARVVHATVAGGGPPSTPRIYRDRLVAAFVALVESDAVSELSPLSAAARLGVPLRTLQEHMQRDLESSPHRVIVHARLRRARQLLRTSDPAFTSVTDVAVRCGFTHLGRFAAQYYSEFGEKPSETLHSV